MFHKLMNKFLGTTLVLVVSFLMLIQAQGLNFEAVKADDWIKIRTIQDLANINNNLKGKYILMNDLDLKAATSTINGEFYHDGAGWEPIGDKESSKSYFSGNFDGNGYTIGGLTISRPKEDFVGLFAATNKATIKNIALKDVNIQGKENVGSLVGRSLTTTIDNVSSSGVVKGESRVGGVLGYVTNSTKANKVLSKISVYGKRSAIGGVIGRMASSSTLKDIHSKAYILVSQCGDSAIVSCSAGGVVGEASSSTKGSNLFFDGKLSNASMQDFDNKGSQYYASPLVGDKNKPKTWTGLYYHADYPSTLTTSLTKSETLEEKSYDSFDFTNTWYINKTARLQNIDYFEPKLTGIKIEQLPNQLEFDEDETIDYSGLEVSLVLRDGSKESVPFSDLWLSLNKKTQQVTITYKEFTEVFDITINPVFHYKLSIKERGHGGKLVVSKEDIKVDDQEEHRQESVLSIETQLEPMGRLKSLMLNDKPFTKKTFVINKESTLEAIFYLLGDVTNNGKLENDDLTQYVDVIYNQINSEITDVNEDGQVNVADYVTLINAIIGRDNKTELLNTKLNKEPTIEIKSFVQENNEVKATLDINSYNQGAVYLQLNPDFDVKDLQVDCNNQCTIEVEENNKAMILSPKDNQLVLENKLSLTLKFHVQQTKSAKQLEFRNIHFSDKTGITVSVLENMSLILEKQEATPPALKTITIDGKEFTFTPSSNEIKYQTTKKQIIILTSPINKEYFILGEGEYTLEEGDNRIEIGVRNSQNQSAIYSLIINYTPIKEESNNSQSQEDNQSKNEVDDTTANKPDKSNKNNGQTSDSALNYSEIGSNSDDKIPETSDFDLYFLAVVIMFLGIFLLNVSNLGRKSTR